MFSHLKIENVEWTIPPLQSLLHRTPSFVFSDAQMNTVKLIIIIIV